jgi:hypothetical protein
MSPKYVMLSGTPAIGGVAVASAMISGITIFVVAQCLKR